MVNKHTPGPWSINEWPQPDTSIAIGAVGTPLIARVMLRDVSINEQKANAHLISAAPRMLEALKACQEAMAYMSEYDIPLTLPGQVKDAIDKATGEQA